MYISTNRQMPPSSNRGFTLVELMISLTIMLIVAMVTVQISANVFRTNTESIHMIQLSQEMRSAIQLISRDIRRAGYNDDALASFLSTQAISSGVTMGALDDNNIANCLRVQYDDLDGGAKNVVYRLRVVTEVGRISAHFDDTATCDTAITDNGWVDISDPILSHISELEFVLDNHLTDIAENTDNGNTIQVGVEQISIIISANLRSNEAVNRSIVNEVQIRNQYLKV
jgi:prepilin-type N-terminal cleavage/methylation domain-containing protein